MCIRSKVVAFFAFACICIEFMSLNAIAIQKQTVNIGIIMDSDAPGLEHTRETFCREVKDLLEDEYTIQFSDKAELIGNWTNEGIKSAVDCGFADPDINMIIGMFCVRWTWFSKYCILPI